MQGLTIKRQGHFRRDQRARKTIGQGPTPDPIPAGTIPCISRLMALAVRLERLIKAGEIVDQANLSCPGRVIRLKNEQTLLGLSRIFNPILRGWYIYDRRFQDNLDSERSNHENTVGWSDGRKPCDKVRGKPHVVINA